MTCRGGDGIGPRTLVQPRDHLIHRGYGDAGDRSGVMSCPANEPRHRARCIRRVVSSQSRSSLGYLRPYRGIIVAGVVSLIATNACFLGVAIALRDGVQALKDAREIQTIADWLNTFQLAPSYTDAVAQWRHASIAVTHDAAVHAVIMLVAYATA